MKVGIIAIAAAFAVSTSAFAADKKVKKAAAPVAPVKVASGSMKTSLFMYQTDAGVYQVTPKLSYQIESTKYQIGGATSDLSDTTLAVTGEYGINEMLSAGFEIARTSRVLKATGSEDVKTTDLEDPYFFLKGRIATGPGVLRFGGQLELALQNRKDDNLSLGRNELNGFVGYEMSSGAATFGGRMSYDIYVGDGTYEDATGKTTFKDGKVFDIAGFYENDMEPMLIGASATIRASEKSMFAPSETELMLDVYGHYIVSPELVILPLLSYTTPIAYDKANISSESNILARVGARYSF